MNTIVMVMNLIIVILISIRFKLTNVKIGAVHFQVNLIVHGALSSLFCITPSLCHICVTQPPWRNGLAHWTSNSKVVGSSPTGGVFFTYF